MTKTRRGSGGNSIFFHFLRRENRGAIFARPGNRQYQLTFTAKRQTEAGDRRDSGLPARQILSEWPITMKYSFIQISEHRIFYQNVHPEPSIAGFITKPVRGQGRHLAR